ncbi:hypothetical protein SCLCIDRAFT_133789 [Scleroderma citrinum Foug A]|uniref:Uncharacterized protein n=1 Tax=Scleroderma citrinum Foug A TaxID=1036808 RepID=A0A0C3DHL3_9AGAM|nr:hypothetical protein SCLCIDRAFT_133789 [Scleroderma citrinum Foug A]
MRLYALYNRSRTLLFIAVSGFVIEIAVVLVTMIRTSIIIGQSLIDHSWKTDCELYCPKSTIYSSQQPMSLLSLPRKKLIYTSVILQWWLMSFCCFP